MFADPCNVDNHETRYEELYRSTTFITTDESRKKCDKDLLRNWYRFISKAGNDMPNYAPNITGACGTTFAVWLSGKITFFLQYILLLIFFYFVLICLCSRLWTNMCELQNNEKHV